MTKQQFDELLLALNTLADDQLWLAASTIVAFAGCRAEKLYRDDIENACAQFFIAMRRAEPGLMAALMQQGHDAH